MACSPLEIRASSNVSFFLAPASHDSSFVPCSSLCCSCLPSRLVSIGGGCWDTGGRRPRGPHLLAIPQNEPIPKCPKIPPKCPKTPRNPPKYVLQDYRGVGGRARLPPKLISLFPSNWQPTTTLAVAGCPTPEHRQGQSRASSPRTSSVPS